ncbi:MAG: AAA family ATPase [Atopobiaceae bacterium]|jgi:MinD-like ATPase involved in chromosome partitioning or flagellar assembly
MRHQWLIYGSSVYQKGLCALVKSSDPLVDCAYVNSAAELRVRAQEEAPYGVMVGPSEEGVSGINTAAALVRDGYVARVLLAEKTPSGSLRSRARIAGVDEVYDLSCLPRSVQDTSCSSFAREARGVRVSRTLEGSREHESFVPPLDEPEMLEERAPTTVVGRSSALAQNVPQIEQALTETPAFSSTMPAARLSQVPQTVKIARTRTSPALMRPTASIKPQHKAPVLTLVSGRGSVGKTTLAAAFAEVGATWGLKVALVDLDLSFGNLYSCFGMRSPADLAALGKERASWDLISRLGKEAASEVYLWGGLELPELAEMVQNHVHDLIELLAQKFDLVIVDTPATVTDAMAQAAQLCDRLLICVDERSSTPVAQARVGALAVRLGVARTRIVRVANRVNPKQKGVPIINRAEVGLETARTYRIVDGGEELIEFLDGGKIVDYLKLRSEFAADVSDCLAHMLKELGVMPQGVDSATKKRMEPKQRRWSFGRRREAV